MQSSSQNNISKVRNIAWSELTGIRFLRHGTGTSIFTAFLVNQSSAERGSVGDNRTCLEPVVIKCPMWGLAASKIKEVTTDLQHEAEMLASLDHPNILKLTGVGQMPLRDGSSAFFLTVPWLIGGVLSERFGHTLPESQQGDEKIALCALATRGGGPPPADAVLPKGFKRKLPGVIVPPARHSKKMNLVTALRIGEELASALRYLHDSADARRVMLHRDLKPDNIGFDDEGRVILLDFGLVTSTPRSPVHSPDGKPQSSASILVQSNASDHETPDTSTSTALNTGSFHLPKYRLTGHTGSVRYMAPEVALDKPYNQSVDIYSFSIILWEMLCRKRPFIGMNVARHREQVCLNGVRPKLNKSVPEDLSSLLTSCWHDDADRRPPFAVIEKHICSLRTQIDGNVVRATVSRANESSTPLPAASLMAWLPRIRLSPRANRSRFFGNSDPSERFTVQQSPPLTKSQSEPRDFRVNTSESTFVKGSSF